MSASSSSTNVVINVPQGLYTKIVTPAGATIGDLVPDLPGGSDPVSSAVLEPKKDTRKQVRITPENPDVPTSITEDTVLHLEGGMLFTSSIPLTDANVELHAHAGTFIPHITVGPHVSVTLDSGAMGVLELIPGGSAYVASGGKASYIEHGGYARCARDKDVTYLDDSSNNTPVEIEITSGNSMTLHEGATARIRIHNGGYAYLMNANYGYGTGDMPLPKPGVTDIAGTLKVVNGCVTEARIQGGGSLIASKCCIEDLRIHSGGTAIVTKGSIACTVLSGGTAILKGCELDSVVAYPGAVVKLHGCIRVFHRKDEHSEEFFTVLGEVWHG